MAQPTTRIPKSVFLAAHPDIPDRWTIGAHLQTSPTAGKQFNTPYMSWPEIEIALREWAADRAEFLLRHFDWDADAVAAQVAAKGLPRSNPHAGLSLKDLGL